MLKAVGVIVGIAGLMLPGLMVDRKTRYKDLRSFLKYLLWLIVGLAIAGAGVWIFQKGGGMPGA